MWFILVIILFLVLVAYLVREKKPDLSEADIILKDYNDAWAQYKETKSDEDHHKYLALKKAYETHRDLRKKK
jgi:hypothetical protein